MATEKTDKNADRLAELEAENERLAAELADAKANQRPVANTRPEVKPPSFGLSEGTREELARTAKAVDPFTGDKLTGTPDDYKREPRKSHAYVPVAADDEGVTTGDVQR